mmetsp:Transcript_18432/g.50859  ORF Transcript_18432/g.50859 Transcript_18432/m.50859 type:complete len:146 (-) Transcript_18432:303-740(-)
MLHSISKYLRQRTCVANACQSCPDGTLLLPGSSCVSYAAFAVPASCIFFGMVGFGVWFWWHLAQVPAKVGPEAKVGMNGVENADETKILTPQDEENDPVTMFSPIFTGQEQTGRQDCSLNDERAQNEADLACVLVPGEGDVEDWP